MTISILVAVANNRVIGYKNKLIWRQSADLKRFKSLTTGGFVVMGRKTYESIGRPLPNRSNIIITRNKNYVAEGCTVVDSFQAALKFCQSQKCQEVFVIGGGQIYEAALPIADKVYLTKIDVSPKGDTFFPDLKGLEWWEINRQEFPADDKNEFDYVFIDLVRGSI